MGVVVKIAKSQIEVSDGCDQKREPGSRRFFMPAARPGAHTGSLCVTSRHAFVVLNISGSVSRLASVAQVAEPVYKEIKRASDVGISTRARQPGP